MTNVEGSMEWFVCSCPMGPTGRRYAVPDHDYLTRVLIHAAMELRNGTLEPRMEVSRANGTDHALAVGNRLSDQLPTRLPPRRVSCSGSQVPSSSGFDPTHRTGRLRVRPLKTDCLNMDRLGRSAPTIRICHEIGGDRYDGQLAKEFRAREPCAEDPLMRKPREAIGEGHFGSFHRWPGRASAIQSARSLTKQRCAWTQRADKTMAEPSPQTPETRLPSSRSCSWLRQPSDK